MKLDSRVRFFTIVATLLFIAMPSHGQDASALSGERVILPQESPAPRPSQITPEISQSLPPGAALDSSEITILRDNFAGKYNIGTLENLSQMYWRLGAFDLQDDVAIGNYVKITDCKVFTDYVNDDMEWSKIVEVMRGHLASARDTFPLNFQFMIELHLGRYDPVKGGFPITDRTEFKDVKRVEVDSVDAREEICFDRQAIKDYPKSLVILLPKPFTLDFVKLDEHVAQAYILRKKSEYNKMEEDVRVQRYERDAFLRLRVSFSQYHGNLRGSEADLMGILYGTIDGYEIFEDSAQKRLMLSVDMTAPAPSGAAPVTSGKSSMMSLPGQSDDIAGNDVAEKSYDDAPANNVMTVRHSFAQ